MDIQISDIKRYPDMMMRDKLDKGLVAQYKETIQDILSVTPIEVYKIDGNYVLTDGFHRLAAAQQFGLDVVPSLVREGSMYDARAAACVANLQHGKPLTRKERKKAICEYIKLKVKLSNVVIAKVIGISDVTIGKYRRELEAAGEIEPQEKRISADGKERPSETTSIISTSKKLGVEDIEEVNSFDEWFDDHALCGDAFEIMPTIGRKFDLAIVDPPYGITTEEWDLTNKHELLAFTRRWLNQVLRLLKPTARLYIFWSREYMFELKPLLDEIAEMYPLNFGGMMVWYFRNVQSMPDSRKRYKLGWEPIFYYYGLEAPDLNFPKTEDTGESWKGRGDVQSDVWTFAIPQSNFKDKRIHPTQKPLELYERIIETATRMDGAVLDPFAGSGTTGHAAMLTGRDFYLIEKEREYVIATANRLRPIWSE